MKHLIIYGSSGNTQGTTWEVTRTLQSLLNDAEIINVSDYSIGFFDYAHQNKDDDFLGLAQKMLACDIVVFATPVYWYAMSAQLKVFFDRLSDLITIRKDMGRKLAGKSMAFIATGHEDVIPEGFHVPFKRTAEYFDMSFIGYLYVCTNTKKYNPINTQSDIAKFSELLISGSD